VEYGTLEYALEAQRWLNLSVFICCQHWCLLVNALNELAAQLRDIRVARLQDFMNLGNIEEREQQMLYRHVLMAAFTRPLKSLVQTKFQLTAEHKDKLLSGFFHGAE
jgi:hypothetical protein